MKSVVSSAEKVHPQDNPIITGHQTSLAKRDYVTFIQTTLYPFKHPPKCTLVD